MDDALLKSLGDEAVGVLSAAWYSASGPSESNKRFVAAMQKEYGVLPGGYSAGMYVAGQCVEAAIQQIGDKADDRKALAEALHKVSLVTRRAAPSSSTSTATWSATFSSAAARRRTASWSTR